MAGRKQVVEQRHLPTLERFQLEDPAQRVEVAIRLGAKRLLEGLAALHRRVDRLGIHVLAQHDAHAADPWQAPDLGPHVVGHQEGEVGRAPIGRQAKADLDPAVAAHRHARDEAEAGHGLVEFRVLHAVKPGQHLASPVVHGSIHSAATRSPACSFAFCASMSMP